MSLRVGLKLGSCLSLVSLLATSTLLAQPDRIHAPIDASRTVVLKGNRSAKAQPQFDLGPVDASLELPYITLQLKPSPVQQAALDRMLADQQTPSSPNYHKWLTPAQFGDRFGISSSDAARITTWLQSAGLRVNDVARGRHWVTFSGNTGRVSRALHTEIHRYRVDGEIHRANAADPSVPADLADIVAGIQGLDDFPDRSDRITVLADSPLFNNGNTHSMSPGDFATIYHLDALYQAGIDGTGQKIAVIGRTNISLSDIRTFRSRYSLPANDPQVVLFGPDPGVSAADQGEAYLDLEWAGAVAPKATIIYVNSTSVTTSAQYAVDQDLAKVMTFSYGACEPRSSPAFRSVAQQAAAQGISWMVSSGDTGGNACDPAFSGTQTSKGRFAAFPASIPEVTAVGGTMFDEGTGTYWATTNGANLSSALSYIPEKAWNETGIGLGGISGSGGGASIFFSKPAWQTGPGVPNDNARDVPDLSLTAAFHDGYRTAYTSNGVLSNFVNTGTSASSPSFAGIVALLNQYLLDHGSIKEPGLGNLNPALYRLAQRTTDVFHDVTTGDTFSPCVQASPNCVNGFSGYPAGPKYDLATGLGSVDAYNLVTEWTIKTEGTVTILASNSSSTDLNGSVQLTANVTGTGGTPTGTVSFTVGDTDTALGSSALSAGSTTLTVPANLLPVGSDTLWAVYSGDANFNGSSASTPIIVTAPASGSVVAASISPNPVYQSTADLQAATWSVGISLRELAGVATTLTAFTVNGASQPVTTFFPTTRAIAPKGVLTTGVVFSGLTVPTTRTLGFTGLDADGRTWSQQVVVTFTGPQQVGPLMLLRAPAGTVQPNPSADPSCQWSQYVYLQEENGYTVKLTKFTSGTTDLTSQIQQIFGATRLAPFGTLQGTVCWSGISAPQTLTSTITGTTETSATVAASLSTSFGVAGAIPSKPSISPTVVAMSVANSTQTASATTTLSFDSAAPAWTATVIPAGRTSSWLQVTPASGTGPATLNLKATGTGLSNGVYNATIAIQAAGAVPQYLNVTVSFAVGVVTGMSIDAASNVFSGEATFAPGMLIGIYGSQLSPSTQTVAALPLPLTNGTVSATVNGVSAPLYYVSSGQFDIQIPYETGAGMAVLGINNNGKVASFTFPVAATAPGLWPHFLTLGGTLTTTAKAGDILVTFMTGDGDITPSLSNGAVPPASTATKNLPQPRLPVTITVGGVPATVLFAGITSAAPGVTQIDFTVPAGTPVGPGIPVIVTVGSVPATPLTLTISQ